MFEPRSATKEKIIDQIRQLADGDEGPTSREFDEHPETFSKQAVQYHFGNWNTAVEAAGLDIKKHTDVTKAEIVEYLKQLADNGQAPRAHEFNDAPNTPTAGAVFTHFETWNDAVKAAGLKPNTRGRRGHSEEEIIEHIIRLADGDKPPTGKEFGADPDAPSVQTVRNKFGSWSEGLEAAGFDSR